jgi:transposase
MKAYSNDLRRKIVSAYERGQRSQREIAELFGVSPRYGAQLRASQERARCAGPTAALRRSARAH